MKFLRETIVICALLNLSLASHHIDPKKHLTTFKWTLHASKESNKNAHVDDAPIFDLFAGEDHHSLALLKCEDFNNHPHGCNLTIQMHSFESMIRQTICIVDVPSKQVQTSIDQIKFLKKDRVLIGWKQKYQRQKSQGVVNDWRMNYQIISTDTCKRSRFIWVKTTHEGSTKFHPILAHDNDFEIVFHDEPHCRSHHYCSISHDYNGKNLDSSHKLFKTKYLDDSEKIIIKDLYLMKGPYEDAPVLIAQGDTPDSEIEKIYSPVLGWKTIITAVHRQRSYSNSSGYATFCWSSRNNQNELACMWLDGSHGDETMRFAFKNHFTKLPFTYNGEDGSILLVRAARDNHENSRVVIDQGQMNGKCKRLVEAEIHDIPLEFKLSIVERDTYCFSYIGKINKIQIAKSKPLSTHYTFNTRCVKAQPEENRELFDCGSERYY